MTTFSLMTMFIHFVFEWVKFATAKYKTGISTSWEFASYPFELQEIRQTKEILDIF